jgi:hypothetical protein
MKAMNTRRLFTAAVVGLAALTAALAHAMDPLASWNNRPAKQAILEFVQKTTDQSGPDFVPPAERIATFDNDGTLWPSHPMYTHVPSSPLPWTG